MWHDVNFLLRFRNRSSAVSYFRWKQSACPVDSKKDHKWPHRGPTVSTSTVVGSWPVGWGSIWTGGPCPQSREPAAILTLSLWQHSLQRQRPPNGGKCARGRWGRGGFQEPLHGGWNSLCWEPQLWLSPCPPRQSDSWTGRKDNSKS